VIVLDPSGKLAQGSDEIRVALEGFMMPGSCAGQLKTRVIEADAVALFISYWRFSGVDATGKNSDWQLTATVVLRKQENGSWWALIDNSFGPMILGQRPEN
jgi:ketosteroid isomerase-like protein